MTKTSAANATATATAAPPPGAPATGPRVGLFVTCLVDLYRPTVGHAAVKLLRAAGCTVVVPRGQTCCGQPAYNSGDRADAAAIAAGLVRAFDQAGVDHVVAPSGSCAGMLKHHVPVLLADHPDLAAPARALADKVHELVSFLTDVRGMTAVDARFDGAVTYHDSCSSLREMEVKAQPRQLLGTVAGLELRELAGTEECCGFGGTFCVKYPDISEKMVDGKAHSVVATGAGTLLAGDLGCLLNISGRLHRRGDSVAARHVAEVLAGLTDTPPIGAPRD